MPVTIHAVAGSGLSVEIAASAVLSMTPDPADDGRTCFFLSDDIVSAEGCYEDWMALFAREWSCRAA